MPPQATLHTYSGRIFATLCASGAQKDLDRTRTLSMDIIIFTSQGRHSGDLVNARQDGQKVQARRPQAARHAESASERGDRPPIRNWRFLRSRRCRTGQVRDASRVTVDKQSVTQSAAAFGFSRPTYYQAEADFQRDGIFGLLPEKRGPRRGHELTPEVLDFAIQLRASDPSLRPLDLAAAIQERFAVNAHPRSIERTLRRQKKNVAASGCWRMQDSIGNTDLRLRRSTATSRRGFEFSWPGHGHFSWPGNGGMDAGVLLGCLYQSRQRPSVSDYCP